MLPTKENITKVSELKTIISGINKLYDKEQKNEEIEIEYSFKLFEIIKNIF